MRRAVLTLGGTAAGLAALLSFKTHAAVSDAAVAPQPSQMSAAAMPGSSPGGSSLGSPASSPSAAPSSAAAKTKPSASTARSAPAAPPKTSSASKPAAPASTPASTKAKPAAGTFTGANENTQYGPVQVQITTNGSKVTGVNELQQPTDSIGANAITQLDAETLAAGNADIQAVSGATYTSEGYLKSLQSAVDQAGL